MREWLAIKRYQVPLFSMATWYFAGCATLLCGVDMLVVSAVVQAAPVTQVVEPQPLVAASQLLQQGRQRHQAGQFLAAQQLWQQAAQTYQTQGAMLNAAQSLNYLSLAQQSLGQWVQAAATIEQSLAILQEIESSEFAQPALFAQALNTQGSLQFATGKVVAALATWQQAEAIYTRADNPAGKLGSQLNQAQALQALGQYRQAQALLERLVAALQAQPDTLLKADGLRSLGVALQTVGDLVQSKALLEQSWRISAQLKDDAATSSTLFSIGNVAKDLQRYDIALAYYQQAIQLAPDGLAKVQAQLNQLRLLVDTQRWVEAQALVPQVQASLSIQPSSRATVYGQVNLAESLMRMHQHGILNGTGLERQQTLVASVPMSGSTTLSTATIAQLLAKTVNQAKALQDPRAEAYALIQLGKLYEQQQQWPGAQQLSTAAFKLAQVLDAADIKARSGRQLGRILKQQGDITGAKAAYQSAFEALQSLRSDLMAINPDIQFDFKENVEPVYRELVSLLLQPGATQADLRQAREVIEALQLAELDNFFRDACLDTQPTQIDQIDAQAAVIYPIILSDRLEVILSLPGQPLRHYATPIPATAVEKTLQALYSAFYLGYSTDERLRLSEQVYNWLLRPAEAALAKSSAQTLVFVPDGFLRNLPIAALYDGQAYLIEKYGVTLSPGLQLFPQRLARNDLKALVAGLTEARQGFNALPAVEQEMSQITTDFKSEQLLNQAFTRTALQKQLDTRSFPVVHLATHGQFSSNPDDTFLLTWDDRMGLQDFDRLFEKRRLGLLAPIELLVMSACQTAAGDDQATLGLAGLALRSGAHSTLASLWSVSDQSTADLMNEFYQQLARTSDATTKAEALRQAQLALLNSAEYSHPYFWASFVLIGNWL
ncbi:MAG: CHAT domain-containing protein [Cyanothece sp. SIO1E1]|nr:CHAT domain-containing protein [Cyanothece sp. SIO1E1]